MPSETLPALDLGHGPTELEIFLEPTCPFSRRAFEKLEALLEGIGEDSSTIRIRFVPQPWHLFSGVVTCTILAASATEGGKDAALKAMAGIMRAGRTSSSRIILRAEHAPHPGRYHCRHIPDRRRRPLRSLPAEICRPRAAPAREICAPERHPRIADLYSGAPVTAFTLWRDAQVKVTRGAELIAGFNKSGFSDRRFCTRCGGHVLVLHPGMGFTDIYAAMLPTLPFRPSVHLNYAETVLPMRDGLPKLKDFPAHAGGSGELPGIAPPLSSLPDLIRQSIP